MIKLLTLFLFSSVSHALVDMNTSSYSSTWIDLDNGAVRIERSYASRTLFIGMFGFGWCSNLERTLDTKTLKASECEQVIDKGYKITKDKTFYVKTNDNGTVERYDFSGRLIYVSSARNSVKLSYDKDMLKEITDDQGSVYRFSYYNAAYPVRKVKQIAGPKGLLTEYKYDSQDNLVWNRNAWAKKDTDVYVYEYTELHNMTKAIWPDKSFITITYDDPKDRVVAFKDRDNCVEKYKYEIYDKLHFWSEVVKTCGTEVVAKNKYEFWYKKTSKGNVVDRVRQIVNNKVTDISYDAVSGQITSLAKDNDVYRYTYDTKGRLFVVENKTNKITITYDTKSRIASFADKQSVTSISYEETFGKPSTVSVIGLGEIKVTYDTYGNIHNVNSTKGKKVASEVAKRFTELLAMIQVAI